MKIGILGGTFNPPHNAHIQMVLEAVEKAGMDRIILIPNGDPPHKHPEITAAHRLAMTRLAAADIKKKLSGTDIDVSDIEIKRSGFSFLVNTIEQIREMMPEDQLYFMAGGDAISSMASWRGADRIFAMTSIIAFKRKDSMGLSIEPAVRYLQKKGARAELVDCELPDISSSALRDMVKAGEDITGMVPASVADYIKENKLYIS